MGATPTTVVTLVSLHYFHALLAASFMITEDASIFTNDLSAGQIRGMNGLRVSIPEPP